MSKRWIQSSSAWCAFCLALSAGLASLAWALSVRELALCYWLAACVAFVAAVSDAATFRISNACTYPAVAGGLLLGMFGDLLASSLGVPPAWIGSAGMAEAVLGAAIWFGLCLPAWTLRWIGGGDLKLCCAIGALLGFSRSLEVLFLAMLAATLLALINILSRGAGVMALRRIGIACMIWAPAQGASPPPAVRLDRIPLAIPILLGVLLYPATVDWLRSWPAF